MAVRGLLRALCCALDQQPQLGLHPALPQAWLQMSRHFPRISSVVSSAPRLQPAHARSFQALALLALAAPQSSLILLSQLRHFQIVSAHFNQNY